MVPSGWIRMRDSGDGQESRYCSHSGRLSVVPITTSNSSMGSRPSGG